MEILVIGKPAINVYLPLQEFPQEGDIFTIRGKNESLGNIGATAACLLAKWGMSTNFTGVLGNDGYAEKIRDTFTENKVKTKFLEVNFERGTSVNYIILNVKDGRVTKILYNDPENQLTKYKYDFIPNFAIIDGTDFAGAHALLNNNANCKTIFYARAGDKDTIAMSKRCSYVVCTQSFAEVMTRFDCEDTVESYVNLYQKIVDAAGNSNYIVILNNHKILYSVDGKVKMLPEMKINVADYSSFDSVFTGALTFCLVNSVAIDDAIKFANTAAAISISRIGEVPAIPSVDEVLDNSGLREKLGLGSSQSTTPSPAPAQEPAPMNPQYQSAANNTTELVNTEPDANTATAFGSAPVQGNPAPAPTPQPAAPQQAETNIFDQPPSA